MNALQLTLLTLVFFAGLTAKALPVVNENAAQTGLLTIYPDHQNPNQFYISPSVVTLAQNADGKPFFSYSEFRENIFTRKALVQMTFVPAYSQSDLDGAKNAILQKNPQAVFSGLPFVKSSIEFADSLAGLVERQDCDHTAGLIGQEISCQWILSPQGRKVFHQLMLKRMLVTTMDYDYSVNAVVRNAQGTFEPFLLQLAIAARLDGSQILGQLPSSP